MTIGLSTTAIGARPFSECLQIYRTLAPDLNLEFLELAIGSRAYINEIPTDLPLMIHNDWVYSPDRLRWQLSLDRDDNWEHYKALTRTHQVLGFSFHFPKHDAMPLDRVLRRRQELEDYLERPFSLELMPDANWHGCAADFAAGLLTGVPLCVDLSHLNIWAKNVSHLALRLTAQLIPQAVSWHVSVNQGIDDSHDLIPCGHWVEETIESLKLTNVPITYEALPIKYATYERRDKQRKRQPCASSYLSNNKT